MGKKRSSPALVIAAFIVALGVLLVFLSIRKEGRDRTVEMTGGKALPKIELLYNTSESHKAIAEAIKEQWHEQLGVDLQLVNKEWKVYLKDTQKLNYNVGRAGWIGDYTDPNTFLDMWVTGGGNNQTGWSNKKYDELIAAAASEPDPQKRMRIFHEAEDMLINDEVPILPLYFYVNQNVVKPFVKGMHFNLRDLHPLKYVWIEKDGKVLPPAAQVFTFNNGAEPETIDPAIMTGSTEFNIAMQLFEGLVINHPETLEPIPAVAESWDISPDRKVYTFHLRKDALWSNGDPVTAEDFRYSWLRALDPKTASDYAYQLYYIKNGKAFNSGEIKDPAKVGIRVADDYTLEVTLENPTTFFLDLVAFHTLLPVNRKCVERHGDKWTRPENIVTNGAFRMVEWKPKDKIVLVKNEKYFGRDNVKLQKVVISAIEDNVTGMRMFEAGETDWMRTVPAPQIDKWINRPETHITPFLTVYYYRFNVTKPPFDDKRVRMAFNLATDKEAIVKYILKAGQVPATHFVPPGIPGYTSPKGRDWDAAKKKYVFNPDKARELLVQAGYQVRKN